MIQTTDATRNGMVISMNETTKKKGGRPTKGSAAATARLVVRLTPAQKKQIDDTCRESETHVSDVVIGALIQLKLIAP